jgi:hypothetical protein
MRNRGLEDVGFYDRERQGFGYHYDPLEIEEMIATVPSDLLRMTPGLNRVTCTDGGPRNPTGISGALDCGTVGPAVYVEGVPWSGDIDDLNVGWIEGLEVFTRNSSTPIQYGGTNGAGGVILIWLK